ncbi:N-acetylglucosamine-6-phosphate deacetylase [Bacillus salacetis]|uniref:N-acetylglucosamine-6-phosphate deacetylase n=1 Tax=Bacillus salacetis TaxID=2315464 RepID=A0A3A1R468_9BACI|nr:N-acetylglucosamine-6-phosphate deacetylase [Bacillus salacetis]RIW34661.1 N-acetylglucosamine-6-phosphate deacetylase [Bacillus salacetis]
MSPKDTDVILLKGLQIYSENGVVDKGYIKIEGKGIIEYGDIKDLIEDGQEKSVEFPSGCKAIPGFIDVHIHGVNGADVMDATPEALEKIADSLPGEGTTSFLATTITQSSNEIEKALKNAGDYIKNQERAGKSEAVGIHLEGPFVNPKRAGAQPSEHITEPNAELFSKWQTVSNHTIKLVTLAPEQPGGLELIRHLKENGIIPSIGHSDATFEQTREAVLAGAAHVTHLFNQMSGLHHREPGVVGAAFLYEELKTELIADGVHVRPEVIKLAYNQKGSEGVILITDSMRAKCLKNGEYDLGGQSVTVKDGRAVLEDGTLAGSILRLGSAVKNMMDYTGCSLHDVIQMASANPAKQLNLFDRKGSIHNGKDADIVILDEEMEVVMTFCRGRLAYKKEE